MQKYLLAAGNTDLTGLQRVQCETPVPADGQVLVRVHAASLNFRDLAILSGQYPGGVLQRDTVPLSDGAGEIAAVGNGVTRVAVGDRVAACFFQGWVDGAADLADMPSLGFQADGMLSEYVVLDQHGVVKIPGHLTWEEAATLPCTGVTAWNALMLCGRIRPGSTVLALGTGGVSIFALQYAKMAGAKVIITSSSDDKLERARRLGADATINYRRTPDWDREVLRLTGGAGVDHIVEVGGAGTLAKSIRAIGFRGCIALIGVLAGPEGDTNPQALMQKNAGLVGIFVGNRVMFEQMNRALSINRVRPVVDRVFPFEAAADAFAWQQQARHFGKVVIRIG